MYYLPDNDIPDDDLTLFNIAKRNSLSFEGEKLISSAESDAEDTLRLCIIFPGLTFQIFIVPSLE